MKAKVYKDSGNQALLLGTLLMFIGAFITFVTFALASASVISFFIITKGLIFVGFLNMCRGIWYILKSHIL